MATYTVTGAFGYSGRYIAERLLAAGHDVRTLTRSPRRTNPFNGEVEVFPLEFARPEALERACDGADVLAPEVTRADVHAIEALPLLIDELVVQDVLIALGSEDHKELDEVLRLCDGKAVSLKLVPGTTP